MDRRSLAAEQFIKGYNCAQSVAIAFADLLGMEEKTLAKMMSGFGGGFGHQGEVCGAISGMTFVINALYGYDDYRATTEKKICYQTSFDMLEQFRACNGSVLCRDLLKDANNPPPANMEIPERYSQRHCTRMVYTAAALAEDFINAHPLEK